MSRPEADAAARPAAGQRPAVHGQAGQALAEQSSPPAGQSAPAGGAINFSGTTAATLVHIELSSEVAPDVFTLANPFRVIVELPDTAFAQKAQQATHGYGLVETYRSGPFSIGKSRIVLETLGPVQATPFPITPAKDGKPAAVEIALTPMPVNAFGAGTGANRPQPGQAKAAPARSAPGGPAPPDFSGLPGGPADPPAMPVIVIDPGHGGIDPGAVGTNDLLEKNIVMAVATKLQQALIAKGHYRVQLTRKEDVFVSLDQRVAMSRQSAANLFISIHADSIEQSSLTQNISGATVYTLSERASDEQARKMAEKENASDLLAGLTPTGKEDDDVKDILIDLMKRETASFSAEFSQVLRNKLKSSVQLSRDPARSAAFKVLKQTHAPSVLIELGYVSNTDEAKRLSSPEWQKKVASSIAAAVDTYFANRSARAQ